jgi:hypothetical protein
LSIILKQGDAKVADDDSEAETSYDDGAVLFLFYLITNICIV